MSGRTGFSGVLTSLTYGPWGWDAQSTLYQQLQTFSEEDQAKLVCDNAVKVFDLN